MVASRIYGWFTCIQCVVFFVKIYTQPRIESRGIVASTKMMKLITPQNFLHFQSDVTMDLLVMCEQNLVHQRMQQNPSLLAVKQQM